MFRRCFISRPDGDRRMDRVLNVEYLVCFMSFNLTRDGLFLCTFVIWFLDYPLPLPDSPHLRLLGWVGSLTLFSRWPPVHLLPAISCRCLTYTSSVDIKGEDVRSKENRFDDEPGETGQGLTLMGLFHPFG